MNDATRSAACCSSRWYAVWAVACAVIAFSSQTRAADSSEFDKLNNQAQSDLVAQLSSATGSVGAMIIQNRSDEWLRKDPTLKAGERATLGLTRVRLVRVLKGSFNVKPGEIVYVYDPSQVQKFILSDPKSGTQKTASPYQPVFLADDVPRLVFVRQEHKPIPERVRQGYEKRDPTLRQFVEDAGSKTSEEHFTAKYGLSEMFSNRVFSIIDRCVFAVDCQVPSLGEASAASMNQANMDREARHLDQLRASNGLIHLTRREMSEVVFVLSMAEGREGVTRFARESEEDSAILEPISEAALRTNIGLKLQQARRRIVTNNLPPQLPENAPTSP